MKRKTEIFINHWLRVLITLKERTDEYTLENLIKTQGRILVGFEPKEFMEEAITSLNYFVENGYITITNHTSNQFTYWGIQKENIEFEFTQKFDELQKELNKKANTLQEGSIASIVHNYIGEYTAGDRINTSSVGSNNPVIIKSQSVMVNYNLIDQLKEKVEQDYKKDDKQEVLKAVEEIKTLSANPNNKSTISSKLGWLLAKTADVATVASLVIQLITTYGPH